jgi:AcrR family transcriptional regulator
MAVSPLSTTTTTRSTSTRSASHAPNGAGESREPRRRARAARRQGLLETAEEVFAERGFGGATMAEIASRAGYSAGNLYNVFDGKDALFAEVLSTRGEQILELVRGALQTGSSLGEIVDRYVGANLELAEAHRGFLVLLTQSTPDFDWHSSRSGPNDVDLRAQLDDQLEQVFRDAMDRGEIPTGDARPYICLLHGSVNAHVARWVRNDGGREELWGSAADLRRFIRRGLGLPANDA